MLHQERRTKIRSRSRNGSAGPSACLARSDFRYHQRSTAWNGCSFAPKPYSGSYRTTEALPEMADGKEEFSGSFRAGEKFLRSSCGARISTRSAKHTEGSNGADTDFFRRDPVVAGYSYASDV